MVGGENRIHVARQQNAHGRLGALHDPEAIAELALRDFALCGDERLRLRGKRFDIGAERGERRAERFVHFRKALKICGACVDCAPLAQAVGHLSSLAVEKRQVL